MLDLSDGCKLFVSQQLSDDAFRKMAGQPAGNSAFVGAVEAGITTKPLDIRLAPGKPTVSMEMFAFHSFKVSPLVTPVDLAFDCIYGSIIYLCLHLFMPFALFL